MPPTPAPMSPAPESPRAQRQHRTLLIASGIALVVIVLIAAYFILRTTAPSLVSEIPGISSLPGLSGLGGATTTEELSYVDNRTPWQAMMDYFIQDVCLDKNGKVMMGVSPIDGNPDCVAHRDLLPGERLPYHKEDPRGSGDTLRLDEMPVDTGTSLGVIAIKLKDNYGDTDGGKGGYLPNVLDLSDGVGNIYLQSSTTIATYSTIDSNGPTYRISSACSNARGGVPDDLLGLMNAQIRVSIDALTQKSGTETTNFAKVYNPGACPTASDYKSDQNAWKLATYSYMRPDGTKTAPLETLVSNDVSSDDNHHFERYYQTKELGRTRFEAWQNTASMDAATKAAYEQHAAQLKAAGGDCATPFEPPPTDSGTWVMYSCGEWTTVTPPADMVHGDYPDQFINALKAGNMTAVLFGLKPTDNPTITSVTPSSFTYGDPVTLTIKGNFPPHDAQNQVIVMIDGGGVHAYATPSADGSTVTYQVVWDAKNATSHSLKQGTHTLHVFDGVSISNGMDFTVAKDNSGAKKNK
ncbi:MAG TPA: hypothetical protein VHB93_01720 [Candidatus Paceibacterota bacterium]|nr:hypothetical protein [Candidatus Paceibacterota bacterium]